MGLFSQISDEWKRNRLSDEFKRWETTYEDWFREDEVEEEALIAPAPPTEEASLQIGDDEDELKKRKTGKGSLKIPLADTSTTGLNT